MTRLKKKEISIVIRWDQYSNW